MARAAQLGSAARRGVIRCNDMNRNAESSFSMLLLLFTSDLMASDLRYVYNTTTSE